MAGACEAQQASGGGCRKELTSSAPSSALSSNRSSPPPPPRLADRQVLRVAEQPSPGRFHRSHQLARCLPSSDALDAGRIAGCVLAGMVRNCCGRPARTWPTSGRPKNFRVGALRPSTRSTNPASLRRLTTTAMEVLDFRLLVSIRRQRGHDLNQATPVAGNPNHIEPYRWLPAVAGNDAVRSLLQIA